MEEERKNLTTDSLRVADLDAENASTVFQECGLDKAGVEMEGETFRTVDADLPDAENDSAVVELDAENDCTVSESLKCGVENQIGVSTCC